MSTTIQQSPFLSTSKYGTNYVQGKDDLNVSPTNGTTHAADSSEQDIAVTVNISEQAKSMYHSALDQKQSASESTEQVSTTNSLDSIEKSYTDSFSELAKNFSNFGAKVFLGGLCVSDISAKNLNFDTLDSLGKKYQDFKDQITSTYSGDEEKQYLEKLDNAYNTVFKQNIIYPLKRLYDDKLQYYKPMDIESLKSYTIWSADKDGVTNTIMHNMAVESIKTKNYSSLEEGTKSFYTLAEDPSSWHDTQKLKSTFTETMNSYASHTQSAYDIDDNGLAKKYASAAAQKVIDQYEAALDYKAGKSGLSDNGIEKTKASENKTSIFDYITASSGGYTIDFNNIPDLSDLLKKEYSKISSYLNDNTQNHN